MVIRRFDHDRRTGSQGRSTHVHRQFLYWSLGIALVVGLAAHVGGYLLRSEMTTEPLGLVADLLSGVGERRSADGEVAVSPSPIVAAVWVVAPERHRGVGRLADRSAIDLKARRRDPSFRPGADERKRPWRR